MKTNLFFSSNNKEYDKDLKRIVRNIWYAHKNERLQLSLTEYWLITCILLKLLIEIFSKLMQALERFEPETFTAVLKCKLFIFSRQFLTDSWICYLQWKGNYQILCHLPGRRPFSYYIIHSKVAVYRTNFLQLLWIHMKRHRDYQEMEAIRLPIWDNKLRKYEGESMCVVSEWSVKKT